MFRSKFMVPWHNCTILVQAELERQRDEEKRKMEKRSDKLNADQKEALLEKFKLDQVKSASVAQ